MWAGERRGGAHTLAVTAASGDFSQAFSLSVEAEVAAVPVDGLLGLALACALTASLWVRRRRPTKLDAGA
ncbi:MAG: hypothetical protein HYV63_01780 [Candidatus Schekmanbacteria bacterium]|nr:hypothetical protein [Candidatus Schekmanbacteria bacterium]